MALIIMQSVNDKKKVSSQRTLQKLLSHSEINVDTKSTSCPLRESFKKKLVEFSTKRGGGFGSADFPLRKI